MSDRLILEQFGPVVFVKGRDELDDLLGRRFNRLSVGRFTPLANHVKFKLVHSFHPRGDQPLTISKFVLGHLASLDQRAPNPLAKHMSDILSSSIRAIMMGIKTE